MYIAWDTETDLIGFSNIVPGLICSSFYDLAEEDAFVLHAEPKQDHKEMMEALFSDDHHIIGHNIAFDTSVAAKAHPDILSLIWQAYYDNRIHDTMIREMLLNLATSGSIDKVGIAGEGRQMTYGLGDLVLQYLGIDISASKEDEDSARLNYYVVKNDPISEWPEEYVQYAKDDAIYTGRVFLAQETRRHKIREERGFDPLATACFRARAHFGLSLMTAQGNRLDPEEVLRVTDEFETRYHDPELVKPLVDAGIVVPARPETPNKRGTKNHQPDCPGHKEHPEYKKNKSVRDCACPVKMNKAQPEKESRTTLHAKVWEMARENDLMEVWASDSLLAALEEDGLKDTVISGSKTIDQGAVETLMRDAKAKDPTALPPKWTISVDNEWRETYYTLHPLLEKYHERKKVEKIVTSYLPKLYWAEGREQCPYILEGRQGRLDGKQPAERVHAQFSPLKETGRCSSRAATKGLGKNQILLYPSWNGQQVDPRVRNCVIPAEGNVLFSVDYSAMELGTAAQVAYNLFGYSVLRDKINAGIDTHAYLGAQIAYALDPYFTSACGSRDPQEAYDCFSELKGWMEPCDSAAFKAVKGEGATWADFFKYYRTFGKPTGLGYPGGLGPRTFIAYAKGTFGVSVDLETATLLREIWRATYPELKEALDYTNKHCEDSWAAPTYEETPDGKFKKQSWYCYTSPLGMHRAHCSYTACANGQFLQTPSAEGALMGNTEIMRECTVGSLKGKVWPSIFIHDEVFGEVEDTDEATDHMAKIDEVLVRNMRIITPDVRAATEPCLMRRWSKMADPVWEEVDGKQYLRVWEPKEENK
jgi:hypothetical protein